jgi:Na+-transporting methylmalonyl-CoA/oxaloacetate decarboxylase gamma subunit
MTDLQLALQITLVGMGLVFGAILVLWGFMYLLTVVIRDRESGQAPELPGEKPPDSLEQNMLRARVAAAAVAMALAEQETSGAHPLPPPPTAIISAWQLGMRTRQMYQKGNLYKKERK